MSDVLWIQVRCEQEVVAASVQKDFQFNSSFPFIHNSYEATVYKHARFSKILVSRRRP